MSKKRETFFSNENFEMIFELLSSDINKKFQQDISQNSTYKNLLFNQMGQCYEQKKSGPIKDINIHTLQTCAPLFMAQLKKKKNLTRLQIIQYHQV